MKYFNHLVFQIKPEDRSAVATFKNIQEASSKTRIAKSHISSCITGKRKRAGGFIWRRVCKYDLIRYHFILKEKLRTMKRRCKFSKSYSHIEVYMTLEDLKFLWRRNRAYFLIEPSIDRKCSTKSYVKNNCRFIEMKENRSRRRQYEPDEQSN